MWIFRQHRIRRRQFRRLFHAPPARQHVTVHIGAHKTGTTYIQRTLDLNRTRLPLTFETVPRRERHLAAITDLTAGCQTPGACAAAASNLEQAARGLLKRYRRVENLLITHEGLPGPLPGRPRFRGLYPMAQHLLPPIIRGLRANGAEVSVVFYKRRFRDWQASLYRYRFIKQPGRGYNPARFAARTGLPGDWSDLIARLQGALGDTPLHVISYEQDRRTGLLGRALYQIAGIEDADIDALIRPAPQNVSRAHTKTDRQFEA